MPKPFKLLCPEWQGGPSDSVHRGTHWLAAELMHGAPDAVVDAPLDESAPDAGGVHSLSLIARHFAAAAAMLDQHRPGHLLMVGGTCGVEAAPVSYLNHLYRGDLAVLWFDAHADMNTPATSPSGNFHGMVLRTLLGDGPPELTARMPRTLLPSQVFLVGVRYLDPAEARFIAQSGIGTYPVETLASAENLCRAIEAAGLRRLYVHFDVDVINPDEFPDALMHAPGGPSLGDLAACLRRLTDSFEIVGTSVVEFKGESADSRRLLTDMLRSVGMAI